MARISSQLILLFASIATLFLVHATDIPEFLHVCSRNDPNLDSCMKESVDYLRPYLNKGVPEYRIPSLEPLILKELVATENAGIKIVAKDVEAYGASDFHIRRIRADLKKMRIGLDLDLPHLHIRGKYNINGRVLLLPITGSGPMSGNFSGCTGAVRLQYHLKKDNNVERVDLTDFKLKISIGKGTLQLDNLFNGEKVLGDVVNNAINSNFDSFIQELQPIVEKALSVAFMDIANSILSQFTYDQLFPNV